MLWMGWSNLSLILLEPSCSNRLSFHNLLIHHPFAFTSQWANIAINHYYKLRSCEYDGRSHFPLLAVTASSAFGADFTFGDCQFPCCSLTHLLPVALCTPRPWLCHCELAPGQPTPPLQTAPFQASKNLSKDRQQGANVRAQGCWTHPPVQLRS